MDLVNAAETSPQTIMFNVSRQEANDIKRRLTEARLGTTGNKVLLKTSAEKK